MLVLILTFAAEIAGAEEPALGARSLAMGRTGVASLQYNTGMRLNPGLLSLTERYDFEGSFLFGPEGGLHWMGSAVDARTSDAIAAGVGYYGNSYNPPPTNEELPGWVAEGEDLSNKKWVHDFVASVSVPMLERRIGFGMTFAPQYHDEELNGNGWTFDMHTGLGIHPIDWLTVGLATRNLLPWGAQYGDTELLGGVLFDTEKLDVETDVEYRPKIDDLPRFGAGAELAQGNARIRAGWRLDQVQEHWASLGIGYEEEGAAIMYGLAAPLGDDFDYLFQGSLHEVSVRFGAQAPIPDVY